MTIQATWESRLGAEATGVVRRRAWLALDGPLVLLVIIVCALTLPSASYYAVAGPVVVAILAAHIYRQARLNRALAAALTRHLGMQVTPRSLPSLRSVAHYDAWLANQRDGTPWRGRSHLGGFIRTRRPPK